MGDEIMFDDESWGTLAISLLYFFSCFVIACRDVLAEGPFKCLSNIQIGLVGDVIRFMNIL
jgi:hypothetical protein